MISEELIFYIHTNVGSRTTVGLVREVSAVVVRIADVSGRYTTCVVARELIRRAGRPRSYTRNHVGLYYIFISIAFSHLHVNFSLNDVSFDKSAKCYIMSCTFCAAHHKFNVSTAKTRSSATAEKQRVSCPHGGREARPSSPLALCPSGYTNAYGRIQKP